ncbi:aldehyde-activating protein [Salinisphaera sp. Q1T1-3]|nr:aldehyde-activating protein [Salinisphaera sp. Q1T1-3]
MYGVDLFNASAWPSEAIKRRVGTGADLIAHRQFGRRMWRYHCSNCGRLVHGRNRRGHIVIPNERFRAANEDSLPERVQPSVHLFYAQRVVDIADALPKHPDDLDAVELDSTDV